MVSDLKLREANFLYALTDLTKDELFDVLNTYDWAFSACKRAVRLCEAELAREYKEIE